MNREVKIKDLGLTEYKKAWDYQEELLNDIVGIKIKNRREGANELTKNYLIFVEHPHVYTLGKSGDISNLLIDESELTKNNAKFYKINRGGDITYHGPGQIVCYPIIDLDNFFTDIHKYLRLLEEVVILTLREYGLNTERSKGETGVWFDVGTENARKICAFGVKSSRWVTMHGFALNINTNLSYFKNIVPCGINKKVTSLERELGGEIEIEDVKEKLKSHLTSLFKMQLV